MENSDDIIDPESYHSRKLDSSNGTAEEYGEVFFLPPKVQTVEYIRL